MIKSDFTFARCVCKKQFALKRILLHTGTIRQDEDTDTRENVLNDAEKERRIFMKKINVLLVCGSGASSGFMAANMRKAAARQKMELEVKARSESEIENYIDEIDALMIGPHLAYLADELKEDYGDYDVKFILMKSEYYAALDGEKAIAHLLEEMN